MSTRIHWTLTALSLALLAAPTIAAPAQWQTVAVQSGNSVEIDKSRVSRLKSGRTAAWTRLTLDHPVLDFENGVRYTAVQALNHYDCAQGSFATQRRIFLLDGRQIKTERVSSPRQIDVQSGSLDARLFDEVCMPSSRAAAAQEQEFRPRPMHAEMVSAGDSLQPRSMKVADAPPAAQAPAERPRFIDMPVIDKSKAEDPLRNSPAAPAAPAALAPAASVPPPAPAPATAQRPPAPPPRAAAPPPAVVIAPELSRQQRELMLATSGPRRTSTPAKKAPEPAVPPPPDYSRVKWGYAGLGAPENWAKLRPQYALCGSGKRQSPIDIRGGIRVDLEPIQFNYRNTYFRIVDNGHTVQVDVGEGSSITVMGRTYHLDHLHFHRPSEERINGRPFDMSVHMVHKDYDGSTAVIAVMMERGSEHPAIQALWNHMPLEVGMEVIPRNVTINPAGLLPEQREYYTYMGSLTTPPCTENVLWMVFKQPIPVSADQISIFARLYPNNARPIQPTNDRLIKGSR